MMRIMVIQSIKIFLALELFVALGWLYSFELFINAQVAFITAFSVIVGSAFAHRRMILGRVANHEETNPKRDLLDSIEDPHELYEESNPTQKDDEELDFKSIIKEERAKIKTFDLKSAGYGVKATLSLLRLIPYLFLILGFIALENNALLTLKFYLPALLLGIFGGYGVSRQLS